MELTIQVKDESKLDFLLQFFREISFVEVLSGLPSTNGNGVVKTPRKKKLTPKQQVMLEGLQDALREVELHRQGKIKLQNAREFLAEEPDAAPSNGVAPITVQKKKLTPRQQEYVDGIKESLQLVELHLQGKIQLPTLEEALAEL